MRHNLKIESRTISALNRLAVPKGFNTVLDLVPKATPFPPNKEMLILVTLANDFTDFAYRYLNYSYSSFDESDLYMSVYSAEAEQRSTKTFVCDDVEYRLRSVWYCNGLILLAERIRS